MATIINNPTVKAMSDSKHINSLDFSALPIRGDSASTARYCTENGYTLDSFTTDSAHFSNDGGRVYNYWDSTNSTWINAFGYDSIVTQIITT